MTDLEHVEPAEPASPEPTPPTPAALFVSGVPRAGVSTVARTLNTDERIALATGRFTRVRDRVQPFHLQAEVFFAPTRHETGPISRRDLYEELRGRFDGGTVRYLGDVQDGYAVRLAVLMPRFPEGRFVVVHRPLSSVLTGDDASRAKTEASWRTTMESARAAAASPHGDRVFLLSSDRLALETAHLEALWSFLDLDVPDAVRQRVDGLRGRAAAEGPAVSDEKDELDRWAEARIAKQERRLR